MFDRFAVLRSAPSLARKGVRRVRAWATLMWRDRTRRDRVQAAVTFAVIGAFTLASIDYLICGGLDWNPGGEAYAMEIASSRAPSETPVAATPPSAPPTRVTAPLHSADHGIFVQELLGGPRFEPVALAEDMSASEFLQLERAQQTTAPARIVSKTALPH